MYFLKKFYNNTLKYDLINVFNFKSNLKLPKINALILNLKLKTCDIKKLSLSLLAFELITQQWGKLIHTSKSKILLKIRKGSAIGCKLIIKKSNLFQFFNTIVLETGLRLNIKKIWNYNVFQFIIQNIINISDLKNHYSFFFHLQSLKVVVLIDYNTKNSIFFLKSLANYFS